MSRSYSFRVPASTSNLGAGFDALSLALERYLRVGLEIGTPALEIISRGVDAHSITTTQDNLILRVANSVASQRNRSLPALRITIDNEIPLARGMGSSAAAIIAGITCYELAAEDRLSEAVELIVDERGAKCSKPDNGIDVAPRRPQSR